MEVQDVVGGVEFRGPVVVAELASLRRWVREEGVDEVGDGDDEGGGEEDEHGDE